MKSSFVAVVALFMVPGTLPSATPAPAEIAKESAKANALFERAYQERVDRSPFRQTQLGIKKDYDKWDDLSEARAAENLARELGYLAELKRTLSFAALDRPTRLSYRLFADGIERQVRAFPYRFHNYPISQNGGFHTGVPSILMNLHRVEDVRDAQAYVARLKGVGPLFDQLIVGLRLRADRGIVPPRWVFPKVEQTIRGLLTGVPFSDGPGDNPIWADFKRKVETAVRPKDGGAAEALLAEGRAALEKDVKAAYVRLLSAWTELAKSATEEDGAWKFPNGPAYYDADLAEQTTTSLTAAEIHAIGLQEVARLHGEMRALLPRVQFAGDPSARSTSSGQASSGQVLPAFFKFLREDPRFYLPDTPEGRKQYLAKASAVIDDMRGRLDSLFITKPKAGLEVRATEAFREKTAAKAFYERGTPDGSRPGAYYSTLYNMREMPTYQIDAIAYHEGIPGHHMQIAIAQELQDIPRFRRTGHYGAYIEGWGLYCELLPKELGLYQDPYSDFGRLAMELWRAVRLVVDTGIHAKRWTRQQAIDYFVANTPQSEAEVVREIERYIVNPGQATTYKIGMIRILELRESAKRELGPKFDLREFHHVVLRDGPVPLDVLAENVRAWVEGQGGETVRP